MRGAHKRLAPSFSLTEKLILLNAGRQPEFRNDHDEHNRADILTPGLNLVPAFPNQPGPVAITHSL